MLYWYHTLSCVRCICISVFDRPTEDLVATSLGRRSNEYFSLAAKDTNFISFHDATPNDVVTGPPDDDTGVNYTNRGDYDDFFSRPILIQEMNWSEGNSLTNHFAPWNLYFTHPRILEKLKGYCRLRARLHLRFMINGSPFRYGDVLVSYRPLWTLNYSGSHDETFGFSGGDCACDDLYYGNTIYDGLSTKIPTRSVNDNQSLMSRSQRMNIRLKVQTNKGGEMVLPFTYPFDAMQLLDTPGSGGETDQTLASMGNIHMQSLFPLTTTTTASTIPVNISIYAWAEDVKVWGPTNLTVQSGDEFSDATKPSAIASLVADVANVFTNVPIIGPFAQATKFAASAASSILRFFGWSNPPIIGPLVGFLPRIGLFQSNPLVSSQDDVLALDPRNEITVDPRIAGTCPMDELSIEYLCSKDTIFDVATWQPTDPANSPIFTLPVAPVYAYTTWLANSSSPSIPCANITMTPATYFAQMFHYWRGDMVLKLEVNCSQFHRGRLAVIWDPSPVLSTSLSLSYGTQITEIIDLASSNICEIKIPFLSHKGYLCVERSLLTTKTSAACTFSRWGNRSTSYGWTSPYNFLNGNIYVTVLNELQSASLATQVYVVASVRFENMRFMEPACDAGMNDSNSNASLRAVAFSNLVVQGEITEPDDTTTYCGEGSYADKLGLLYGGESVPSLRPLLHRSYFDRIYEVPAAALNCPMASVYAPWFPQSRFQPNSVLPHQGALVPTAYGGTGTTYTTEWCATTPISYITNCFTGFRGSMVHKFALNGDSASYGCTLISAHRAVLSNCNLTNYVTMNDVGATQQNDRHYLALCDNMGGASISSSTNNGCVSVQVPMYSNWRMFPGSTVRRLWNYLLGNTSFFNLSDKAVVCNVVMPLNTNTVTQPHLSLLHSVACGHDFTVLGFVNTPDIYLANIND